MLKVLSRLLLLIPRVCTVSKFIPSKVLRKVFEIRTLFAFVTVAGKFNWDRAGRASQLIVFTDFNEPIARVERRVKFFNVNDPLIEFIVVDPRLVKPPAFSHIKFPFNCCGPSIEIIPAAEGPMTIFPPTTEQEARADASAWEFMVAVG